MTPPVSSGPPRRLSWSRRERRSRSQETLIGVEVAAEDSEVGGAEAVVEDAEAEEAGRKRTPTTPNLGTETGGGTGPRAHLQEGSLREDSPPGGTGQGQETGTGDPAHPPMTESLVFMTGSPVLTTGQHHLLLTGRPVPMTGQHHLLMTGLRHQIDSHPQLMTGRPHPAELHPPTTGQLLHPAGLPLPMTDPQEILPAEAPHPMTGLQPTLRAELPRLTTGPVPPHTTRPPE